MNQRYAQRRHSRACQPRPRARICARDHSEPAGRMRMYSAEVQQQTHAAAVCHGRRHPALATATRCPVGPHAGGPIRRRPPSRCGAPSYTRTGPSHTSQGATTRYLAPGRSYRSSTPIRAPPAGTADAVLSSTPLPQESFFWVGVAHSLSYFRSPTMAVTSSRPVPLQRRGR